MAFVNGMVAPSANPLRWSPLPLTGRLPLVISTYLRPSAERGRMSTVEFFGSGLIEVWSLSLSCAVTVPSLCACGVIVSTTPTRAPPMRTSLPRTRLAALGTSAVS